jgi:tungstate transport system substrate-binding protein
VILGATTSTYDSGLLEWLLERFAAEHPGLAVRTIVVGSGEALELGRRGDVDVLLVHAPAAEARFQSEGHVRLRAPVMFNSFVIVGPAGDPAAIRAVDTPAGAFARIASNEATFVSRGDSSGTHERELEMWRLAGVTPSPPWHVETGQGQATTLQIASQRRGYALTDRATFDGLRSILDLEPLIEGHPLLINRYSVILPLRGVNAAAAETLATWLTSESGRAAIGEFRLPGVAGPPFSPAEPDPPQGSGTGAESAPVVEDSTRTPVTGAR